MTGNILLVMLLSAACSGMSAQVTHVGMRVNLHPLHSIEINLEGFNGVTHQPLNTNEAWADQIKINSTEGYRVVLHTGGGTVNSTDAAKYITDRPAHFLPHSQPESQKSHFTYAYLESMTGSIDKIFTLVYNKKKPVKEPENSRILLSIEPR